MGLGDVVGVGVGARVSQSKGCCLALGGVVACMYSSTTYQFT